MLNWLDNLPMGMLVMMTFLLGLAPFVPEPHLWEKLKMLAAGTLVRPIDIFDLLMHSAPAILLAMKVVREQKKKSQANG